MLVHEVLQYRIEFLRLFVEGTSALVEVPNTKVNREILTELTDTSNLYQDPSLPLLNGDLLTFQLQSAI